MSGSYNTVGKLKGEVASSGQPAAKSNPPIDDELDALQCLLDLAGMVPGAGVVPDLINAAISAMRGDFMGAALNLFSAVPAIGDVAGAAKIAKNGQKYLDAIKTLETKVLPKLPDRIRQPLQNFIGKAKAKLDDLMGTKPQSAHQKKPETKPEKKSEKEGEKEGNTRVKGGGKKVGDCGENLAKNDLKQEGFDEVVSVQNNSGHGVDLVGRNSKTGEVKVWEVKTTEGSSAPSLKGDQAKLGGKDFTKDRLGRASSGKSNYGKVPEAIENAEKVLDWLKKAGDKVSYEKREVFIDNIEKGCMKHPKRPSRSKSWNAK